MKDKVRRLIGAVLGSAAMFLILFGVFAVIALVGGNLMALFGFRYESIGSLLLYFLLGAVVGLPLEIFSTALPRALYKMGKMSRWEANFLYIPLDTLFTMGVFWLVDQWMQSVSASGLSLWIVGFWMALTTLPIPKERGNKSERD